MASWGVPSAAARREAPFAAPVLPFADFHRSVMDAEFGHYRTARVRDRAAFAEQRAHLLAHYAGVSAVHSFADDGGQIFDCIAIERQPALRRSGRRLAAPPALPRVGLPAPPPPLRPGRSDRHGNAMACPPGTVAIRRLTLDELTRFETLAHFQRKSPSRLVADLHGAPDGDGVATAAGDQHQYAHAAQTVRNRGGAGVLNIWSPPVHDDMVFSLSQQWYVARGPRGVQTVEAGWQVYPRRYGHGRPVLFSYWTADGYATTGSYGTEGHDFVQVSASWPVGVSLDEVSAPGGAQAEIGIGWLLGEGNWWLFVGNGDAAEPVGYYPAALFAGGGLAQGAEAIDHGGETLGVTSYPPMGSGAFAAAGTGRAAYQRNICYFAENGEVRPATLRPSQAWPLSYTIQLGRAPAWGAHFHFGGPGNALAA